MSHHSTSGDSLAHIYQEEEHLVIHHHIPDMPTNARHTNMMKTSKYGKKKRLWQQQQQWQHVMFCSGLHIVAGCGAIGEHMTAPAAEPESYIRLCHLGSLVLQGTHPSEVLSNGIDLAPTRTEFRREYLHFSELSYTTHRLVSFQRR